MHCPKQENALKDRSGIVDHHPPGTAEGLKQVKLQNLPYSCSYSRMSMKTQNYMGRAWGVIPPSPPLAN
jgi:hypothetical protein